MWLQSHTQYTRYSWSIIIKFNCINSDFSFKHKLCFPFRLLSDPESLDRYLLEAGFEQVFHTQPTPVAHSASGSRYIFDRSITPPVESEAESPEVDRFTVQLKKDENGLGITIAGNRLWACVKGKSWCNYLIAIHYIFMVLINVLLYALVWFYKSKYLIADHYNKLIFHCSL